MAKNNREFEYRLFGLLTTLCLLNNASTFNCQGQDACKGDTTVCNENKACTLNCNGNSACRDLTFYCAADYPCVVNCASGHAVCRDLKLHGENATSLNVLADSDGSTNIYYSNIFCPTNGGSCSFTCNGTADCNFMTINGQQAGSLTVTSNSGQLGTATIKCPSPGGLCDIFLSENIPNNAMNAMKIYSSIYDVDITCNAPIFDCYTNSSTVGVVPRLYCYGNTYCEIERDIVDKSLWTCSNPSHECNSYSVSPTQNPTNNPTQSTQSPSNSPTTHSLNPTQTPSNNPSNDPSNNPSQSPSDNPTSSPTDTNSPTEFPTQSPTQSQPIDAQTNAKHTLQLNSFHFMFLTLYLCYSFFV